MIDYSRIVEDYHVMNNGHPKQIMKVEEETETQITLLCDRYSLWTFDKKTGFYAGQQRSRNDSGCTFIRKKPNHMPVDQFHVKGGKPEWLKDNWVILDTKDSVDAAKALVADHNAKARETGSDWSFRIAKETIMSDVPLNVEWAEQRFESGFWTRVPWEDKYPEHGAHVSRQDMGYVAYWCNNADAARELLTVVRAGSYLKEFYSEIPDHEIETLVTKMDPPGVIELSGPEPDDIYNAYIRCEEEGGVHSCMSYSDDQENHDGDEWPEGNPVRVYGAGDLQVAMLIRNGRAVARALVWPEKRVFGRRYGDCKRMKDALIAAGYTQDADGNDMHANGEGGFNGARILKIPVGSGNFVMPYIDLGYNVVDEGEHFTLNNQRGRQATRTSGTLFEYDNEDEYCGHCDRRRELEHTVQGQDICQSCYENDTADCEISGNRYFIHNLVEVEGTGFVSYDHVTYDYTQNRYVLVQREEQAA